MGGALHILDGLFRQAIHEVEIDGGYARGARKLHGVFDDLERLHTANGLLHMGVQILHAKAHPVDANGGEGVGQRLVDRARIKLDGVFLDAGHIKARAQRRP
jgi:hypothetical protein